MMPSPAGFEQGQLQFLSQWMPESSRFGEMGPGTPGDTVSGSVHSSGSLMIQDPDDSFIGQFAPLPISRSSSSASIDVSSPGGSNKTIGEIQLSDASINIDLQSIQDLLRNTKNLPLIAKLEQLKQMQYRMQEQLKAHQHEQQLRIHGPQRLIGIPENSAETSTWSQEQSMVELDTGDECDDGYKECFATEEQTVYIKKSDLEPKERPIKSGFDGRTFEELLEEQLKMENSRLMEKNSDNPKAPSLNPKVSLNSDQTTKIKPKSKAEGSKSIQRKTVSLNKENVQQNKPTPPVTKMTIQSRVNAHQGQNVTSNPAQLHASTNSHTTGNKNNAHCLNEETACIPENSFEVWFTERRQHWEQDQQRECAELGEFELLERAADEISFSSNSSFMKTLLQRDHRRLSSTPVKSTIHLVAATKHQGSPVAPCPTVEQRAIEPLTNNLMSNVFINELSEEETNENVDDELLCIDSEFRRLPKTSKPTTNDGFQEPITLPYDKRTYQDRDGASSPGDERNSSTSEDFTLTETRAHLEFDDDDTWNDPEESCDLIEASQSEKMLKRKVAFAKEVKPFGCSPKNVENPKKAPSACHLISKPKASPPQRVLEPQNMPSEDGAVQSRLLRERLVALETEIERFKSENTALAKLKQENQNIRDSLKKEQTEFEKKRMEEMCMWDEFKKEETKKLTREKKLFEKYAATARARPDKQERDEIQALKQLISTLQEDLRKREVRWSNTHSRLRQQVDSLTAENTSLKDQVRTLEKLRLSAWKSAERQKERGRTLGSNLANFGCSDTDSKSSSRTNRNGCPETRISLTDSEQTSEMDEASPGGNQCSAGREMKKKHPESSLTGTAVSQTAEEQEEGTQTDKIEKVLPDGGRIVVFPNGSRKEISADGQTVKVMFFNGDVKHTMPDQRVIYFYAEAQTTHITYPDGMEVLQFPNNQTEKHFPDGRKEITFPDQTVKTLHPDGTEESVLTDGTIIQLNPDGSKVIQFNTGQREIHMADFKRREYPDGTVKTVYSDGRQETQYPTGRVRLKDAHGHVIMDTKA
ncbi:hypothetical protein DNTS_027286 [Danionella cerebrum]|uniref:Centromere protein J C-terminal domain-containing protein n=1 Tax=Danionella cerebrum TaxID=2873325 RepID=A0A553R4J9_9TELE|nr:hypothetical protein DNTS_027286 [Danionella translucida]